MWVQEPLALFPRTLQARALAGKQRECEDSLAFSTSAAVAFPAVACVQPHELCPHWLWSTLILSLQVILQTPVQLPLQHMLL